MIHQFRIFGAAGRHIINYALCVYYIYQSIQYLNDGVCVMTIYLNINIHIKSTMDPYISVCRLLFSLNAAADQTKAIISKIPDKFLNAIQIFN